MNERDMGGIDKAGTRKSGRLRIDLEHLVVSSSKARLPAMKSEPADRKALLGCLRCLKVYLELGEHRASHVTWHF